MSLNQRLEQRWSQTTTHSVVWPLRDVDPARLEWALRRAVRGADPQSWLGEWMASRPTADPFAGEQLVQRVEAHTQVELMELSSSTPRGDLPLRFLVAPGGVAFAYSHEIGDGNTTTSILSSVVAHLRDDDAEPAVLGPTARDGQLVRSQLMLWTRRPKCLVRCAAAAVRRRREPDEAAAVPAQIGSADARILTCLLDAGQVDRIDAWRHEQTEVPSSTMTLLWMVGRALQEEGHPAPQRWHVMVSLRKRHRELARLGGNLLGRAVVQVDGSSTPASIMRSVAEQADSGELLLVHLLKLAREGLMAGLTKVRRGADAGIGGTASSGLGWSDRGRHAWNGVFDDLDEAPMVYTSSAPVLVGMAVNINWVGDRASLVFSVNAPPLDDASLDRAIARLGSDPVGLLPQALQPDRPDDGVPLLGAEDAAAVPGDVDVVVGVV